MIGAMAVGISIWNCFTYYLEKWVTSGLMKILPPIVVATSHYGNRIRPCRNSGDMAMNITVEQ